MPKIETINKPSDTKPLLRIQFFFYFLQNFNKNYPYSLQKKHSIKQCYTELVTIIPWKTDLGICIQTYKFSKEQINLNQLYTYYCI